MARMSRRRCEWANIPASAQSFALTIDDPDAPSGIWVHWILFNLPPEIASLPDNMPTDDHSPTARDRAATISARLATADPARRVAKRTVTSFKLYALDTMLDLQPGAMRRMLIGALDGHILDEGELMGVFRVA